MVIIYTHTHTYKSLFIMMNNNVFKKISCCLRIFNNIDRWKKYVKIWQINALDSLNVLLFFWFNIIFQFFCGVIRLHVFYLTITGIDSSNKHKKFYLQLSKYKLFIILGDSSDNFLRFPIKMLFSMKIEFGRHFFLTKEDAQLQLLLLLLKVVSRLRVMCYDDVYDMEKKEKKNVQWTIDNINISMIFMQPPSSSLLSMIKNRVWWRVFILCVCVLSGKVCIFFSKHKREKLLQKKKGFFSAQRW